MDIFSGITSILGGGITGLIGSTVQRIYEFKSKKLDIELQKEKFNYDIALKKADAEIQQGHDKALVEVEDSKAFKEAISSEPKQFHESNLTYKQNWLMVVLDFVRGAIRPCLTIYLCAITTLIYFQAKEVMGGMISATSAFDLVDKIVQTILYLTTTCVLFWFGSRNKK